MSFGRLPLALVACGAAACAVSSTSNRSGWREPYTLAGQFVVPRPQPPDPPGIRFGGLSGLASLGNGRELLAVADDRDRPRVFRLTVDTSPDLAVRTPRDAFRVTTSGVIYLEAGPGAPSELDAEAIAVTPDGHMFITSEGVGDEPRSPPAIIEYSSDGRFLKQLPVRRRYAPNERNRLTTGVRDNAGFESLAVTSDGSRMFTATELPLAQDGDVDSFAPGARSRLLEYVATGGTYEPRREFAYELEPMRRPPFDPRFAITGVVELLIWGGDELLAMERGFVESTDRTRALNRILLYRISLKGATDVSSYDTLRGRTDIVPVRKTLVADVSRVEGLRPPLKSLDNFEGMAWGPPLGGRASLILVSDDNFSERQVTAFLLLRVGGIRY